MPNLLYEAGYAHALNKPCIHICSTSTEKLPFDVSHWKTTMYHPGQTHKLAKELAQRLKAVLDRFGTPASRTRSDRDDPLGALKLAKNLQPYFEHCI